MSNNSKPLVSIIIPCYNYSHTISETINSVLDQTYHNWEALIIDDGSIDETEEVVKSFLQKDSRVFYHFQQNRGLSAARNKGISLAKGIYLLFLDSDDILLSTMLEKCVRKFEQNSKYDLVFTGTYYGSHDLKENIGCLSPKKDLNNPFTQLSIKNIAPCHAVMIKSRVIDNTGRFDENLKSCEDWDLWLRIARTTNIFGAVCEPLCVYRMSQNSMSRNPQTFFEAAKIVLNRALQKYDPRVRNQIPDLKNITIKDHNLAIIRWIMLNTGTCVFNNRLEFGNSFFRDNIKGYEAYINADSFKDMVSYLTFTKDKTDEEINEFHRYNSKNLMLFLTQQEDTLKISGLAANAYVIVLSNAGYQWDLAINNIPIIKLLTLVSKRILQKIK